MLARQPQLLLGMRPEMPTATHQQPAMPQRRVMRQLPARQPLAMQPVLLASLARRASLARLSQRAAQLHRTQQESPSLKGFRAQALCP